MPSSLCCHLLTYPLAERTWHDQHFAQALTLHSSHTLGRAQKSAQSRNLEHRMAIRWNSGELNIVCPVCMSYLLLRQEFPHGLRSIAKKVYEAPAIRVARVKLDGLCKACICRKKLSGHISSGWYYTVSRVMKANITDPKSWHRRYCLWESLNTLSRAAVTSWLRIASVRRGEVGNCMHVACTRIAVMNRPIACSSDIFSSASPFGWKFSQSE